MGACVTVNCEARLLAQRLGLDLKNFFEIVLHSSGDNWTFRRWNPAPGVVPESPASRGYEAGFKTWLLAKDLHLAFEAGESVGVRVATGETAHGLLRKHADTGGADFDASSLVLGLGKSARAYRGNQVNQTLRVRLPRPSVSSWAVEVMLSTFGTATHSRRPQGRRQKGTHHAIT
jgi:hypothetical protein